MFTNELRTKTQLVFNGDKKDTYDFYFVEEAF